MNICTYNLKLGAYMDGELSADEMEQAEAHLATCQSCAGELRQLRAVSEFLGGMSIQAIPHEALDRIHASVSALENARRLTRLAGSLAALAAGLALTVTLWTNLGATGNGAAMAEAPAWEQAAITASATEQPGTTQSDEVAVAEWVVKDLSAGGKKP